MLTNSTFKYLAQLALVLLLSNMASATASAQPQRNAQKIVTCHSNNSEYQRCNVHNWSGVELIRQVSKTPCVRGDNWGVDGEWMWVSGGCRGDFGEVVRAQPRSPDPRGEIVMDFTKSCHSNNGKFKRCQVGLWDDAALVQNDSRTRCVRGDNWDLDGTTIWVSDGCRGVFAEVRHRQDRPVRRGGQRRANRRPPSRARPPTGHNWDREIRFVCQSHDQHYKFCSVDVGPRGWVELDKRESRAQCIERQSWGWNRAGIWVDQGCRAKFVVHRRR